MVSHSVTQISPCVMLNKQKYFTINDKVNPIYSNPLSNVKLKVIPQYQVGDLILALNLREGPKWYHASVVQKLGINIYSVLVKEMDIVCTQINFY